MLPTGSPREPSSFCTDGTWQPEAGWKLVLPTLGNYEVEHVAPYGARTDSSKTQSCSTPTSKISGFNSPTFSITPCSSVQVFIHQYPLSVCREPQNLRHNHGGCNSSRAQYKAVWLPMSLSFLACRCLFPAASSITGNSVLTRGPEREHGFDALP